MIGPETWLVTLVTWAGPVPVPPTPATRGRGRPPTSPDRLGLQALGMMSGRPRHPGPARRSGLAQPTPARQTRRALVPVDGRLPTRRTWERRRQAMPATWPAPLGCLGRALVARSRPWARWGRAAALDRTGRRARGGVWHTKDRAAGLVPHPAIETAAHWTTSGGPGWV
jgi:hypothetical protein